MNRRQIGLLHRRSSTRANTSGLNSLHLAWARFSRATVACWRALVLSSLLVAPEKEIVMADDERDFIDRAESMTGKLYGKPASMDQIAENFALYGLKKRAATLDNFDTELRDEIDSSPHNLRRRVQLMALRKKMGGVHEALRKARR
jgi:hypothetical protein